MAPYINKIGEIMPGVGKKKFSYTKKGKAAAKSYAKKKGLKVRKIKRIKKKY